MRRGVRECLGAGDGMRDKVPVHPAPGLVASKKLDVEHGRVDTDGGVVVVVGVTAVANGEAEEGQIGAEQATEVVGAAVSPLALAGPVRGVVVRVCDLANVAEVGQDPAGLVDDEDVVGLDVVVAVASGVKVADHGQDPVEGRAEDAVEILDVGFGARPTERFGQVLERAGGDVRRHQVPVRGHRVVGVGGCNDEVVESREQADGVVELLIDSVDVHARKPQRRLDLGGPFAWLSFKSTPEFIRHFIPASLEPSLYHHRPMSGHILVHLRISLAALTELSYEAVPVVELGLAARSVCDPKRRWRELERSER